MKNLFNYVLVILLFIMAFPIIIQSQNLLRQPESVTYDAKRNRYLVSNKQNGEIISINENGEQTKYITGLGSCRGILILKDDLFVASELGVIGVNLETSVTFLNMPISGSMFLNDIAADSSNNLYMSDSQLNEIFKLNLKTKEVSVLASYNIKGCNGLLYDYSKNRLLVCLSNFPGMVKAIDLMTLTISDVCKTNLDQCDGLTDDSDGNIYISSWKENSVYRYNSTFSKSKELVSSGHLGPADIYFCKSKNILVVPNFNGNSIEFITILPTTIKDKKSNSCFELYQNYPNPFNPSTLIEFVLPESVFTKLTIYDILGREVRIIVNGIMNAGYHKVKFDASDLPSGLYIYQIHSSKFNQSKKMLLVK